MSNITPITSNLPAKYAGFFAVDDMADDLSSGVSGGFAVVSIRGSKWRIKHGGEETPVLNAEQEPVPSLEVVILKGSKDVSHIYYKKSFEEGDVEEPDCWSLNGREPDVGAPHKQSKTCATCPHAVWGSKITSAGKKTKACQDNRRVAIVPGGDVKNEVYGGAMLLRVPAASLADLALYGHKLKAKGIPYNTVVTRLGFDVHASYPKLTFKAVRVLQPHELEAAGEHYLSGKIDAILTNAPAEVAAAAPVAEAAPAVNVDFEEEPAPAQAVDPAELKKAEAAKKKADMAAAKKATDARVAAAAASAAAQAAEKAEASESTDSDLDDILKDLEALS